MREPLQRHLAGVRRFAALLQQGWNRLNVRVISRNPHIDCLLALASVEVLVRYRPEPAG